MTSSMTAAMLDSRMDPIQYEARSRLTLDLDLDDVTSGDGREKSTTLRSEDSGIVMMSEIQRDGKTRFPRSPGFHFGLDEETTRNHEEEEEEEEDEEEEIRDQDIEVEIACPSPGTNSLSTQGSGFDSKRSSVHSSETMDLAERIQSPEAKEAQGNVWMVDAASELAPDQEDMAVAGWKEQDEDEEEEEEKEEEEEEEKTIRKESPLTVDFVRENLNCTEAHKAVDILKTRYRLADVTIRKNNPSRTSGKSSEFWDYIPVSRLYERPQYDYFGSKQLKEVCREIETRNRHLSIILSKILAEDERAKREEEEVMAATAKRFPSAYVAPELDFFSTSSPPPCAYPETTFSKKPEDQTPTADGVDGGGGVDAQPTKKKHRSMLRRAINGLRKSFSRRPSTRV